MPRDRAYENQPGRVARPHNRCIAEFDVRMPYLSVEILLVPGHPDDGAADRLSLSQPRAYLNIRHLGPVVRQLMGDSSLQRPPGNDKRVRPRQLQLVTGLGSILKRLEAAWPGPRACASSRYCKARTLSWCAS